MPSLMTTNKTHFKFSLKKHDNAHITYILVLFAHFLSLQAALRSIGYMNTAAEPSTGERCAVARVTGGNSSTMSVCTTCFNIKLINDNAPVAYLGGASQINNSVRVLYSSPVRSSVAVAASNTTVTDADTDGTIQSIAAEITSPTLDEAVWLMPCGQKTSGVCALQ